MIARLGTGEIEGWCVCVCVKIFGGDEAGCLPIWVLEVASIALKNFPFGDIDVVEDVDNVVAVQKWRKIMGQRGQESREDS